MNFLKTQLQRATIWWKRSKLHSPRFYAALLKVAWEIVKLIFFGG